MSSQFKHRLTANAELLCELDISAKTTPIGPIADGFRLNIDLTGQVKGQKLNGKILPPAGDWMIVRTDGVVVLDVKCTVQTDDNAMIHFTYQGFGESGTDGYQKLLKGELKGKVPLRIYPILQSAHPQYQWVNRLFCVGIGEVDFGTGQVKYDIYSLPFP